MEPSKIGINQIQLNPMDPNFMENLMKNFDSNLTEDSGKYNVLFRLNNPFFQKIMIFDKECSLSKAIKEFCLSFNDGGFFYGKVVDMKVIIAYNGMKLNFDDVNPIKYFFGSNFNPKVFLEDMDAVLIG